jgi:hypothetical protein
MRMHEKLGIAPLNPIRGRSINRCQLFLPVNYDNRILDIADRIVSREDGRLVTGSKKLQPANT